MAEPDLARALIRRMCHDLASPLAAWQTVRALGLADEEAKLLEEAAIARLTERLELWRLLGAAPDSPLETTGLQALLGAECAGAVPLTIDLPPTLAPVLARAGAALLLAAWHLPGATPLALMPDAGGLVLLLAQGPDAQAAAARLASPDPADPALALARLAAALAGPPLLLAGPDGPRLRITRTTA